MKQFLEYLKNPSVNMRKALTDKSYKKKYERECHRKFEGEVNFELATYGDALLKMVLCKLLFEKKIAKLTKEKQNYETDKVLVEKIAKYYKILEYIQFDNGDDKLPKDYVYGDTKNNKNHHKFIATAVEACLAAIYIDTKSIECVENIVRSWINYMDK